MRYVEEQLHQYGGLDIGFGRLRGASRMSASIARSLSFRRISSTSMPCPKGRLPHHHFRIYLNAMCSHRMSSNFNKDQRQMHSVLAWLIPLISSTDCHVSSISLPHEMHYFMRTAFRPLPNRGRTGNRKAE